MKFTVLPVKSLHLRQGSHVHVSFEDRGMEYHVTATRMGLRDEYVSIHRAERFPAPPPSYMWLGKDAEAT